MRILKKISFVLLMFVGSTLAVALSANKAQAHNPPTFTLDTTNFSFKINGKEVDKNNLNEILEAIHHGNRKVEKTNKTLYIYDEFGLVIEQDSKGISIHVLFTPSENENDPKSVFTGVVNLNSMVVNSSSKIVDVLKQLPKTEKTIVTETVLIYINKKAVVMCDNKDGVLIGLSFGFKNK